MVEQSHYTPACNPILSLIFKSGWDAGSSPAGHPDLKTKDRMGLQADVQ